MNNRRTGGAGGGPARAVAWFTLALALFCASDAVAQQASAVTVQTLGGGPVVEGGPFHGYREGGAIQNSQFDDPHGLAVDLSGNILIADRDNNAIRRLSISADRVSSLLTNLNKPVAVAVDLAGNLYVLNQGNGTIVKYDKFNFPVFTWTGLATPTALAIDRSTNLVVAEAGGRVKLLSGTNNTQSVLVEGLGNPQGVAVLDSGHVAVSDAGRNQVIIYNPNTKAVVRTVGTGAAAFRDGPVSLASFNAPHHIAKAPNGSLVVADKGNHRVRLIGGDDTVITVYGVDTNLWFSPFPGWEDGSAEFAESRDPVGVAVSTNGVIFTTELFYHLVRRATGAATGGAGSGGGPGGDLVLPPTLSISSGTAQTTGYHPMGTIITVVNPNTNSFFSNRVFYTTDGSDPTTNDFEVVMTNNVGAIYWRETARDLTSLKVRAFSGNTPSTAVSGQAAIANELGMPRDLPAGIGATLILPIVANMIPGEVLRSLQFLIEVEPQGAAKPLRFPIRTLPVGANEFIPVITASTNEPSTILDTVGTTTRLAVSYVGTNADFTVRGFAIVAMLSLPIPVDALPGDTYLMKVSKVSGTTDGQQGFIRLTNMPPRTITVSTNLHYLVGDSSPTAWYNAEQQGAVGTFGDGRLDNRDVNNAFYASPGVRVPYDGSDAFDSMDVFPEDSAFSVGGDLKIRFLDWQYILQRALGLRTNNFRRMWVPGGFRVAQSASAGLANSPDNTSSATNVNAASVWFRPALVGALPVVNAVPGAFVKVPVYLNVAAGYGIGGMAFNAKVSPEGGANALADAPSWEAATGMPQPIQGSGPGNSLLLGWNLGSFNSALQGSNLLGYVTMKVPAGTATGSRYRVGFSHASGSPDFNTEYDFESISAVVGVQTAAYAAVDGVSDEWKLNFFNSISGSFAQGAADPDGDGISNLQEYRQGTHPAEFRLHGLGSAWTAGLGQGEFKLRWFGASGKGYALEVSASAAGGNWTVLTTRVGTDDYQEFVDTSSREGARFYRLRSSP